MNFKWNRRSFLSALGVVSSGLFRPAERVFAKESKSKEANASGNGSPIVPIKSGLGSSGNVYAELGVTPLVNINGTLTVIGGSVMPAEVIEVLRQGNEHCVSIDDLEVAAGNWMSKLCKWPGGYTGLVTGGAAAGIVVGYAGMMTEDLMPRIRSIPRVAGFPKTEVIIQKAHRNPFDHQIRQTGATLVEVETREEMVHAINPKTLAIHFLHINEDKGQVSGAEILDIAKAHGIYTFNDAAADVPPIDRLWAFAQQGWDLITFSGGKDIKGPQATGLLIGKERLLHYALLNMSPQEDTIGRACKVGKEEIVAFLKALELFVNQNYEETLSGYDADAQLITNALKKFGVTEVPRRYDPNGLGNVTPLYSWRIDPSKVKLAGADVREQLAATRPVAIGTLGAGAGGATGRWPAGDTEQDVQEGTLEWNPQTQSLTPVSRPWSDRPEGGRGGGRSRGDQDPQVFGFAVWQLKKGEAKIIADRLVEIFRQAPKA